MKNTEIKRIRKLVGYLFAITGTNELKKPYMHDRSRSVEQEYWSVMELLTDRVVDISGPSHDELAGQRQMDF